MVRGGPAPGCRTGRRSGRRDPRRAGFSQGPLSPAVSRKVTFHRLARRELNALAQYYESASAGLGEAFLQEIERRIQHVVLYPHSAAPFPSPAHQTGRADFPHPAFRLASPQAHERGPNCTRRSRNTPSSPNPTSAENACLAMAPCDASAETAALLGRRSYPRPDTPSSGSHG